MSSIEIRRGPQRFRTDAEGIVSWHSFSFGRHYDTDNISFGPMLAHNEERIAPAAGFDRHEHRGVDLVTYVVTGTLLHGDSDGGRESVATGSVAVLHAADPVSHVERNASDADPLVFLQTWLRPGPAKTDPTYAVHELPGVVDVSSNARLHVLRVGAGQVIDVPVAPYVHLFVVRGSAVLTDGRLIAAGDAVRSQTDAIGALRSVDPMDLLVWSMKD